MHLLLPPSEMKRPGGDATFDPAHLRHQVSLGAARARVERALVSLCEDDAAAAAKALKLGAKNRDELQYNLALRESPVLAAADRYAGVLYDALDAGGLDPAARAWLDSHVSVQSALFGLLGAGERIPIYRLSGSTRLPQLGGPLKRIWSEAHTSLDWGALGWVLDLRSNDYAALAPLPAGAGLRLHVAQRGPGGEVRALNHFNKAAKGDLVRRLAASGAQIDGPEALLDWASEADLELVPSERAGELTLVTKLGAPKTASVTLG